MTPTPVPGARLARQNINDAFILGAVNELIKGAGTATLEAKNTVDAAYRMLAQQLERIITAVVDHHFASPAPFQMPERGLMFVQVRPTFYT